MTGNRTTELQSLSKLKMAGKLHYWRGTIEMPEAELHAICDEIQAEHEQAIEDWNSRADEQRIAELEQLVRNMWESITWMHGMSDAKKREYRERMKELGIEV